MSENIINCAICLMEVQNQVGLPCGHRFCRLCIDTHLNIKSQCPLCRRVFCPLIGEDYQFYLNEQSQDKFQNDCSIQQYKIFSQGTIEQRLKNQKIPLIQHMSFIAPSQYHVTTETGIEAVNIALKSNLYLAFQPIYIEQYKLCDVMMITNIYRMQNNQTGYICELEKIVRAKILRKQESVQTSKDGTLYILKSLQLKPIMDDVKDQQEVIYSLLQSIRQKKENTQSQLSEPSQTWFKKYFPVIPALKNFQDVNNSENLRRITNFSTSAIEVIMVNNWENLQVNYKQDLKMRLESIDSYLVPCKENNTDQTMLVSQ